MDSSSSDIQSTLPPLTPRERKNSVQSRRNRPVQIYCAPKSTELSQVQMGCAPSRPARSFYQEFFVERPLAKQQFADRSAQNRKAKDPKSVNTHSHSRSDASDNPLMTYVTTMEPQAPAMELPDRGIHELGVETRAPMTVDDTGIASVGEEPARGDLKIYQEEVEARRREEGERYYLAHKVLDPNGTWVF